MNRIFSIIFLLFLVKAGFAEEIDTLTIEKAVQIALENHPSLKAAKLNLEREEVLKKASFDIDKTEFNYKRGEINSGAKDYELEIMQGIKFPTAYIAQSKLQKQKILLGEKALNLNSIELEKNVRSSWYALAYEEEKLLLIQEIEKLYSSFSDVAEKRYKAGESNYLEKTTALGQFQKVKLDKEQAEAEVLKAKYMLQVYLGKEVEFELPANGLRRSILQVQDSLNPSENAGLEFYKQEISVNEQMQKLAKSEFLPDLKAGYFNQQIEGVKGFTGIKLGVSVPLFFWSTQANAKAAGLSTDIARAQYESHLRMKSNEYLVSVQELNKYLGKIHWFEEQGKKITDELLRYAKNGFNAGEIDYLEYVNAVEQAISIKIDYLHALNEYHQLMNEIKFMTGY